MPQNSDSMGPLWHLPNIHQPGSPLPEIPCLCEPHDYDKQGFFNYPSRQGWLIDYASHEGPVRIKDGTKTTPSNAEKGAFIQAWLFFGMLYEAFSIFEVEIDLEEFIVRHADGSPRCITTFPCRKYFGKCIDAGGKRTITSRIEAHNDLAKLFKLVAWNIRRYEDTLAPTSWRMSEVLSLDAILCIQVLGESLINLAQITLPVQRDASALLSGEVGFLRARNPLQKRMLREGWCLSTTTMLHDLLDTTGLYIASRMHMFDSSTRQDHSSCTTVHCYANQVDEKTYQTKHTQECQGCAHIAVDVDKVTAILLRGQIPLVAITESTGRHPSIQLEVVTDHPYVALSHVWAQGLGNARTNSLPYCQLSKIKRMASQLKPTDSAPDSSKLAIWVDTLCIPVSPSLKDVRRLAITRLATTYREAEHVQVLEMGLMSSSRTASRIEMCSRLLSSAWLRRLWTYQEAVLSKKGLHGDKLQIQFSDGPVPFWELLKSERSLCHSEKALQSLLLMLPVTGNVAFRLSTLARALQYRTTSRHEDEAICLTSVLGHEVSSITATSSAEERMAIFYSFADHVPRNIIFRNMPRLETPGYRWAPKSFLQQSTRIATAGSFEAPRDENGVYLDLVALEFCSITPPTWPNWHFVLTEGAGKRHWSLRPAESKSGTNEAEWKKIIADWAAFDNLVLNAARGAVILNEDRAGLHALVSISGEEEQTRFCRFLGLALVLSEENLESHVGKQGVITVKIVERAPSGMRARWCVG
jgi:hypothetical protein